jgi:1-acyl-sn-glycerol-3-phosphate acyltransferase
MTGPGPHAALRWQPGPLLRALLWRAVWTLGGGLRVSGPRPTGPAVVVANHASHADTAALLAALPARSAPVFAAAADYWFDVPVRRALVTGLVSALPVRRGGDGAYAAVRRAAEPVLSSGGVVVVYPEGTRSTDGRVGEFRPGALRLAREAGVPLVPAAVVGTADVLPKHGRLRPGPAEVRFAAPVPVRELAGITVDDVRATVAGLADQGPPVPRTSGVWRAVSGRVASRSFLPVAFAWGVAEALSWPVIAEMSLVLLAVAVPWRVLPAAAALAAGSVVGVVLHAWLVRNGVPVPLPLTTARMRATAAEHLAGGPMGVWHQAFNGIPVKVYAAEAGRGGTDLVGLAAAAALERTTRILGLGVLLAVASGWLHPWLRRLYGPYLAAVAAAFGAGLIATVAHWS